MPNKDFLENYPLYRKFQIALPPYLSQVPTPAIHMPCGVCKSHQTFNMMNKYGETYVNSDAGTAGEVVRALYYCSDCKKFLRYFFLFFDPNRQYVIKIGQTPAWEITLDRNLGKMLGSHSDYYKKGLTCESQGYGIGAFSYYRRIVEEIIDELLTDIADLIPEGQHEEYMGALKEVKKTIVAQDKIKLVKDLLPPTLRPDNINPLAILYEILSEGLHGKDDETCLELAMELRNPIVYLVNQVILRKSEAKSFTDGMRKFLDKKTKRET
ncbi:MAG: hypothetical protein ACLQUW_12315 [Desulfobaccales bacterium]